MKNIILPLLLAVTGISYHNTAVPTARQKAIAIRRRFYHKAGIPGIHHDPALTALINKPDHRPTRTSTTPIRRSVRFLPGTKE